eukprot:scaffold919_cov96-Skeletonema_dohrnii-CCMP3373.AAC.10
MQQLPSPFAPKSARVASVPKAAVDGKMEIRRIINKWQHNRQYGFAPTEVAAPWIKKMDEFLKENAFLSRCYDVEGRKFRPCSCLSILQNERYRRAVARYCVNFLQRPSDEQNQIIIDMQKDASANSSEWYPLPYDCGEMDNMKEAVVALDQHRICRIAIGTITQMGSWRWYNNKRLSSTTGVAKEHGNVKKRRTKRSTAAQKQTNHHATGTTTISDVVVGEDPRKGIVSPIQLEPDIVKSTAYDEETVDETFPPLDGKCVFVPDEIKSEVSPYDEDTDIEGEGGEENDLI